MHLRFDGATDIGCVRARNEDDFLVDAELGLAVVADGIGGLARGDVAATVACRAVREHLRRYRRDLDAFRFDPVAYKRERVEDRLREAVQHANSEVFHAGIALSDGKGMGCTLEAALVIEQTAFVAHVGDARTYLIDGGGACRAITEDHSVVQEKVRKGLMTAEEARTAPGRNLITRAVGHLPTVRVDTQSLRVDVGHRLVLVTDGVTRYVEDAEVGLVCHLGDHRGPHDLVELARSRGGVDNITAVVASCVAHPPLPVDARLLDELRRSWLMCKLTARELRAVAEVAEVRDYKAGRVLFRENTPGDELFIVLDGEVTVTRGGKALAVCRAGDLVGEIALLDPPARSATALVTQATRLAAIPKLRWDHLLRAEEGVAARVLGAVAGRLSGVVRDQNQKISG